jgi:hypothetical protein
MPVEVGLSNGNGTHGVIATIIVADEDEVALVDQLMAHIQSLALLSRESPEALCVIAREHYQLPIGHDAPSQEVSQENVGLLRFRLAIECGGIASALAAMQGLPPGEARQQLHINLRRHIPMLRDYFQDYP